MLKMHLAGFKDLQLDNLVLDYNGTLVCDRRPLEGPHSLAICNPIGVF